VIPGRRTLFRGAELAFTGARGPALDADRRAALQRLQPPDPDSQARTAAIVPS